MNFFIEKHDMEIILDSLNMLRSYMLETRGFALNLPYTEDEVDGLFQSLENSGGE
jgi:hypothetical protein